MTKEGTGFARAYSNGRLAVSLAAKTSLSLGRPILSSRDAGSISNMAAGGQGRLTDTAATDSFGGTSRTGGLKGYGKGATAIWAANGLSVVAVSKVFDKAVSFAGIADAKVATVCCRGRGSRGRLSARKVSRDGETGSGPT